LNEGRRSQIKKPLRRCEAGLLKTAFLFAHEKWIALEAIEALNTEL